MAKSNKDGLGDRMKRYEQAQKHVLPPRMPMVIRVDGKAFHTYTRGCDRPFDMKLEDVMNRTALELCSQIQGAEMAYVQSDEISILVHYYKRFNSEAWFDNELQKVVSVSAAIASSTFTAESWRIWALSNPQEARAAIFSDAIKPACFDSRAFVLPEEEVCNYFIWRQKDFERNSVQMLARSLYSHKELLNKGNAELQEMCFKKGHNWDSLPTTQKRGRVIRKNAAAAGVVSRGSWKVDVEIPIFAKEREYVNDFLTREEGGNELNGGPTA